MDMYVEENLDLDPLRLLGILNSLGNVVPLRAEVDLPLVREEIQRFEEKFSAYIPSKKGFNRYGLSITNLSGKIEPGTDLDSLREIYEKTGKDYDEMDFNKPTELSEQSIEIKRLVRIFSPHVGRSHVIRLNKGGFFPPHRDSVGLLPKVFRVFVPVNFVQSYDFILDGRLLALESGRAYLINTQLAHSIFSYVEKSDFLIFNIRLCQDAVNQVIGLLATS